jgi:membrane associated rhomboid family serine protease
MKDMNEINEPPLRGPWPAWGLAAVILASYPAQTVWLGGVDAAAARFGLVADEVGRGRWYSLATSLFIHGGWAHVAMNAVGALAFGAPVARLLGTRAGGAVSFALFYLVCGILAGLGYVAVNPHGMAPVVGASGAVSGLFGAASRLMEHRPNLSPFASRFVVGSAAAWIMVNLALGLTGFAPGLGAVQVAWQAHIFGYAAGLFLIGPWARLFRGREGQAQPS